ncbi:acyl-coenzyme A oxidase 3, peroxisomal-like [Dorcoceras hygrometricum]|uniref:Acyl-coenzyme A oxidase 3, peroxisomal-like n=1 Tax=Dorcoceras hygrometricum TaxID=472368 RepID=A0A2Z7AM94_9LAMI|nr:acyl-coenzyme A oxidase 3, peroxisomal-like [Dorcoceras hygrometricum]
MVRTVLVERVRGQGFVVGPEEGIRHLSVLECEALAIIASRLDILQGCALLLWVSALTCCSRVLLEVLCRDCIVLLCPRNQVMNRWKRIGLEGLLNLGTRDLKGLK